MPSSLLAFPWDADSWPGSQHEVRSRSWGEPDLVGCRASLWLLWSAVSVLQQRLEAGVSDESGPS